MRVYRAIAVFLALCLMFSCLGISAWAQKTNTIQVGEKVTFSTTQKNHIVYYQFTPQTAGTYVLYDLSDGSFQAWLSVHTADPTEGDQYLIAEGMNQVIFQAQAGVTYWLKLDCSWVSGGELTNSFMLAEPKAAKGMEIGYASMKSQYVGSEGRLFLQYTPVGSAAQVNWSTTDSRVVTVEGDANGASFRLNGPGNAVITATTEDGLSARYSVESLDVLDMQVGQKRSVTMFPSNGSYVTDEKYIRFTPAASGSYVLSVSYDQSLEVWHGLDMSLTTADGYNHSSKSLRIDAVAGKTYSVCVEFWGMYDREVEYTFSLQSTVAPASMTLVPETTIGYVGSTVHVEVEWNPDNSFGSGVSWTVSDSTVAKFTSTDDGCAKVQLLAAGTVKVTAATADGLSDSVVLTVYNHPGKIKLVQGKNPGLQLLPHDYFDCSFSAPVTGYYRITSNQKNLKVQLDASTVVRQGEKLYYLESGRTYTGGIDNLSEKLMEAEITVELVEVPTPAAIKITQLPDQTEFLPGVLDDIWLYDLLEGMEMEVTWSDGNISTWAFNKHGNTFENYEVRWELRKTGTNTVDLVMKLGDTSTSCQLTVKDLTVVSMELLGAKTLQIVENSCGYYDDYAKSWIYSDYLLGIHEIKITFNDGSSVNARAGQTVLGKRLNCDHTQYEKPWVKGGKNTVVYSYGKLSISVPVEIIDSPVRRIQFVSKPRTSFTIGDKKFFVSYGDDTYYFSPDSLKDYIKGLSFRIYYQDGSEKLIKWADIQWIKVSGVNYPFVDGYPLGLLGELMMSYDPISGPMTGQGLVEYMGATLTYDIQFVAPPENVPGTADVSLVVPAAMAVAALLTMAAVLTLKKKYF